MITRLEIGGEDYPLAVNVPININYVLADIREPDKRNSSFSKTIQIFGSNKVNQLFESIYEINVTLNTFNPNKKIEARYFANNVMVFKGSLRLMSIIQKPDNSIIYECSIIGYENSIFFDIGESLLSDLDFSAYNHTYSRANIINSFSSLTTSNGYYYPTNIDNGTSLSESDYKVENFIPCFFVKEYIDKIFANLGYTYTSSAFNSAFFKSLIVYPNANEIKLTQTQIDNSQFYVGFNSDQTLTIPGLNTNNYDKENGGFFDVGNQVSGTVTTLNESGNYNLAAVNKLRFSFTHTDPTVTYCNIQVGILNTIIKKSSDGGASYFNLAAIGEYFGGSVSTDVNVGVNLDFTQSLATGSTLLSAGDKFKVDTYITYSPPITYYNASNVQVITGTGTPVFKLLGGFGNSSFYALYTSATAVDGNTIQVNKILPSNIKQRDFFKSIIQAFNLYIDYDRNNEKNLIIESYTDFFNSGTVDWSRKTDINKDLKFNPIGLLDAKRYIYKYKDDKDFYNVKYKDKWNETYGSEIITVDNDFLKDDKVTELIFSPSPTVANYSVIRNDIKIYKNQLSREKEVPNIRLLIANGKKTSGSTFTFRSVGLSDIVTNEYNEALMETDALFPLATIQFGFPRELYYDYLQSSFTSVNLYNIGYNSQITNITSKDSRIDTRFLYLNENEIRNFDFRKKYFIDGCFFIVNKIVDYNPMVEGSYKVELIRLLETW